MSSPFVTPYAYKKFEKHEELKDQLLQMIEATHCKPVPEKSEKISRTDWFTSRTPKKDYSQLLIPAITKDVAACIDSLNYYKSYDKLDVLDIWFQQYSKSDEHVWHKHEDCTWVCIYYVQLPEGSPKTLLRDIGNDNTIITPDVKEGDILIIPSNVYHCSPPNESDDVKTIISFNFK
jgi:cupin superfamily acireductone dioxygenase involved in methionine salvage